MSGSTSHCASPMLQTAVTEESVTSLPRLRPEMMVRKPRRAKMEVKKSFILSETVSERIRNAESEKEEER